MKDLKKLFKIIWKNREFVQAWGFDSNAGMNIQRGKMKCGENEPKKNWGRDLNYNKYIEIAQKFLIFY